VRIRPEPDGRVLLELLGEAKPYAVHVAATVLREFLDETESVVATGTEADEEMIDALIARLLEY
jgi:hypothetical protein